MADRQKYNFLTALLRQVKESGRDGDELYQEWCEIRDAGQQSVDSSFVEFEGRIAALDSRCDAHAQWLASLEARLEDVEQAIELIAGEEADSDDDGDYDEDLGGDEPRLGSDRRDAGRSPAPVVRTGDGQEPRRGVKQHSRGSRVKAQPEMRKVSSGAKP